MAWQHLKAVKETGTVKLPTHVVCDPEPTSASSTGVVCFFSVMTEMVLLVQDQLLVLPARVRVKRAQLVNGRGFETSTSSRHFDSRACVLHDQQAKCLAVLSENQNEGPGASLIKA